MNRRWRSAILIAFGLSGLVACSKSDAAVSTSTSTAVVSAPETAGKALVVDIIANDKGFTPSAVDIKKGTATTLVFTRTSDETCAKQVVFPELKITKDLPLNERVSFDVPVADARTLTFQCGMGMFKGKIVIL